MGYRKRLPVDNSDGEELPTRFMHLTSGENVYMVTAQTPEPS